MGSCSTESLRRAPCAAIAPFCITGTSHHAQPPGRVCRNLMLRPHAKRVSNILFAKKINSKTRWRNIMWRRDRMAPMDNHVMSNGAACRNSHSTSWGPSPGTAVECEKPNGEVEWAQPQKCRMALVAQNRAKQFQPIQDRLECAARAAHTWRYS